MPAPSNKKNRPLSFGLMFAGIASVIEHTGLHWLDTWLRRIQNSRQPVKTWEQKKQVGWGAAYGKGGVAVTRSLYKGFWSSGIYKLLARMMVFGGQQPVAAYLNKEIHPATLSSMVMINALAGGCVAAMQVVLTPLDAIKIKKQNGDLRSIGQIVCDEQAALFKGASATLLRNVPGAIVQFSVWSAVNAWLSEQSTPSFSHHCLASILGALAAVVITNPQDVVKTMIQTRNGSVCTSGVAREAYQQLGMHGLFTRGLGMRLLTAGPKFALPLMLTGYMWKEYDKLIALNTTSTNHIESILRSNQ